MSGPGGGRFAWFASTLHALLALSLTAGIALTAHAQRLSSLRNDAITADPAVAGAQAQVQAAEQRVVQAQAGFGPTAALSLNKSETRYNEAPAFDLRRFAGKQASLQVTQPLVRIGLLPALEGAQAQLEQAQATLEQARAEATTRLLEGVFEVLKSRDVLALLGTQRLAAEEQLASARRSFKVGTASVIDLREAEAKIDTVTAQGIAAQAELDLKQELLLELAGRSAPELLERGLMGDRMPNLQAAGVHEWIADAQLRSPQLQAAQHALLAAEAEVRKAWQGHAPTADLTYTYTINSDTGTVTSSFPRRGNSAQVGVNVNIPLFASGATQAKVKETMALRDKARSDVDAVRRSVQIGVRQSFTAALSSVSLAHGLETATRSLEAAMQANRRGYEVGLKVNADVLVAQSKVFESRRDLSRARYDAWLNFLKLKAYAGRLVDADINELDAMLVPLPPTSTRGRKAAPETTR